LTLFPETTCSTWCG